jgi:hypothetical protein
MARGDPAVDVVEHALAELDLFLEHLDVGRFQRSLLLKEWQVKTGLQARIMERIAPKEPLVNPLVFALDT